MRKPILVFILLVAALAAFAQPSNDECTNPIVLDDVFSFCSPTGSFTNVGGTPSAYGPAVCFGATDNDVWFAFTAQATDITITVRGATAQAPGGTLQNPQVSLYLGTCNGVINELGCETAPPAADIVELYEGGLFVGSTYLIRIQGQADATGTFQICLNNYNPPVDPESDCPDAAILCDKSAFVVQSVTGAGADISELNGADCFFNGAPGNFESNSTWFVWTCSQSGPLEFTLTPLNPNDDLDFVVYRLPNGINNCNGKEIVRCMASGESGPNAFQSPCMGPTGLRPGDPDVSEDAGCNESGDNAWLSPLPMVAGESYALVVNNFTSTGNGFSVEFGGSGQFLGPAADFTTVPAAVCLGTPVQIVDASTFALGSITSWTWSFGADAMPQTATGPGPHNVTFNTSGTRPVVLTLETNLGCKITDIETVEIYPDVEVDTVVATPDCNGGTNGQITITNITMGTPDYQYSWEGGPFTPDNTLDSIGIGVYNLVIRDANNCETELDIPVNEKILTVDADVMPPLCNGDANGSITLNVTNGTAPFQFDWGSGFQPDNTMGGFSEGVYTILGRDAELCNGIFVVEVEDHPEVGLTLDTTDISCFGADDGVGTALPSGGVGNFTFLWSDSQTMGEATGLAPGAYTVTATDANGCSITGSIFITEPADVGVNLIDVVNLLCNGVPSGEIRVEGVGGVQPYLFSADGGIFGPDPNLTGLAAGDYFVLIEDANGCRDSVAATLTQPPPIGVSVFPADTTLDLGFSIDLQSITSPAGRTFTYEWTPALGLSDPTVAEPMLTATESGPYVLKITDDDGCMAFDTLRLLVNKRRPIYVPNVFKPENAVDFQNSRFTLFGGPAAEKIALLRIYDRWGELVFEAAEIELGDPLQGWDGTYKDKLLTGVFTFYALVRFIDQQELPYEGDVTVLR